MSNKLILDCSTGKLTEQDYTNEEKQAIEQQKLQEQLNLPYQQPNVTDNEVNMAQAIIDINDRLIKGGL